MPTDEDVIEKQLRKNKVDPLWGCHSSVLDLNRAGHTGVDNYPVGGFEAGKGRFMMMMRQPEQRLMSSYTFRDNFGETVSDVVQLQAGCMTKMLRKGKFQPEGRPCIQATPTRADIEEAKLRVRTGFAFIGSTDQWDLSICLFNVMFKQPCHSHQFRNARPTTKKTGETYDISPLNGFRDPYDTEVYEVGMKIFADNLMKYNVSESSCQSCWSEAGLVRA